MITLAIDTSTAVGSVALWHDSQPQAERTFGRDGLFAALTAMPVDLKSVDVYAVGLGPGSFTGIRAGLAAAKGLAIPGQRPIKGVNSFDALALTVAPQTPPDCPQLCVLGDARRDEVYYAIYNRDGQPQTEIRIAPLEAIADEIHNPIWFVSSTIEKFARPIAESFGGFATVCSASLFPSAGAVAWLSEQGRDLGHLEPLYLRATDYRKT